MTSLPDTADKLRAEIDNGRAGDKVPASDPAAAPLGTDDEAAGKPPTREQVVTAATAELRPRGRSRLRAMSGFPTLYLLIVIPVIAAILLAILFGLMGRAS